MNRTSVAHTQAALIRSKLADKNRWKELIAIDERSLALFRIVIAITVLVDLASYLPYLRLFLTGDGIYPLFAAQADRGASPSISLFFLNDSYGYTLLLFGIAALAAVALLLGYYTNIAVIICWIMVVSLTQRTMAFWYYADLLLGLLLFWGMFLPLGAYFSVDRALSRVQGPPRLYAGIASLAILLQHSYLYTMGALLKSGAWLDGTAVQRAISIRQYRGPLTSFIESYPDFTRFLSLYVYHLEFYTIFILFIPVFTAYARIALFFGLFAMHMGFVLFLHVGYFPLVSIAGLTLFLPQLFWKRIDQWINRNGRYREVTIYYDGDCGFCKKISLILREFSIFRGAAIVPAQDHPDMYEILLRENSWVVKDHRRRLLLRWDAVAYFLLYSPLFWPVGVFFWLPFMRPAGKALYRLIAHNRGVLGKLTARCWPYREHAAWRMPLAVNAMVAVMAVFTFGHNLKHLPRYASLAPFPEVARPAFDALNLSQKWNMFGNPPTYSLWATIHGKLENEQWVDLMYQAPQVQPEQRFPEYGEQAFPGIRWNEVFILYNWHKYNGIFGQSECRLWNEDHTVKMDQVVVTLYRQENILYAPKDVWPTLKRTILDYKCN